MGRPGHENAAAFGYAGKDPADPDRPAFPKARVATISEYGSHAVTDAEIGGVAGKGAGEQAPARRLYRRLDRDWLLLCGDPLARFISLLGGNDGEHLIAHLGTRRSRTHRDRDP